MNRPACPLDGAHDPEAVLVTREDVKLLRTAAQHKKGSQQASGFSDELLFQAANSALWHTVALTLIHDRRDQDLHEQQERFKKAYADFQETIASLTNVDLRHSVELPNSYVERIKDNWHLNYAQPREGGRPIEWRKDEFFIRLLTLYKLFSGEQPAGTEDGPAVRFMHEIVAILRRVLATVPDKTTERYRLINSLWQLPRNGTFLKEWFRTKRNTIDIQDEVDTYSGFYIAAYGQEPSTLLDRS